MWVAKNTRRNAAAHLDKGTENVAVEKEEYSGAGSTSGRGISSHVA